MWGRGRHLEPVSDVFPEPSMDLTLPEPRDKRKTVLKVKCFIEAALRDSNGAFVS